jgi:integrase
MYLDNANKHVATLCNMLNRGVAWKRIAENPIAGIKPLPHDTPAKQRRALTTDEINALVAASPPELRPVWKMFLSTGMRHDELVELTFDDVDFERATVTVTASAAKSHKAREIPIGDEMLSILAGLRNQAPFRQPASSELPASFSREHVFVTRAGTPWRNNLLARFYTCCRKAGISDAVPGGSIDIHSLRVTFTTLALEGGARPRAVQAILGHSTLAMTMRVYARATDHTKRDAIACRPFAKGRSGQRPTITRPNAHTSRTDSNIAMQTQREKKLA